MALSRRTFLRYTALSTGSLVVADVFARPARAAVPSKVNVAFFLETKPTMIAKGEGWFEEGVRGRKRGRDQHRDGSRQLRHRAGHRIIADRGRNQSGHPLPADRHGR